MASFCRWKWWQLQFSETTTLQRTWPGCCCVTMASWTGSRWKGWRTHWFHDFHGNYMGIMWEWKIWAIYIYIYNTHTCINYIYVLITYWYIYIYNCIYIYTHLICICVYIYTWEVRGNYGEIHELGISQPRTQMTAASWWGYGYTLTFDASVDEEVLQILSDRELIPEGRGRRG